MKLRIAYISFEYPPDSAFGGIATYVAQVSNLMVSRGHNVEVFCSSPHRLISEQVDGLLVHRIPCIERIDFHSQILPIFTERHETEAFDLVESPEYFGDGYAVKKKYPSLPLVVKLHTPQFLIHEMTYSYVTPFAKARYMGGGLIRGKVSKPFWKWNKKENDIDYQITKVADQVHTPSVSLGKIVAERWNISKPIFNVPYPFIPNKDFLNIPIGVNDPERKVFTFVGRLEIRKGLVQLVPAAAIVLNKIPNARFKIVGASLESHISGLSMKDFILRELKDYIDRIEFMSVQAHQIPGVLADSDVCVYPSVWENFPNVCLEAMSAGKAIVGSREGGMKDMLQNPMAGLLINPSKSSEIAAAIITLLHNPDLRVKLGVAARNKILTAYNNDRIGTLMETHYNELLVAV